MSTLILYLFFFFNDTATTEIYTLSLHDALPILRARSRERPARSSPIRSSCPRGRRGDARCGHARPRRVDRKSTRLNSSHLVISYAVFCLKKKKKQKNRHGYYSRKMARRGHHNST